MPLRLEVAIARPAPSTHEGLKVGVALTNDGEAPVVVPHPEDRSGALAFDLFDVAGRHVRRMDGLTHQHMMTRARVDGRPSLAPLGPGERWTWEVDLASFHYAVAPGRYELEAVLSVPGDDVPVRSARAPLAVRAEPLSALAARHDNPVLDGLALLATAGGAGGASHYLRQHNYSRPLAAWYSEPILQDTVVADGPVLASPTFFRTDTFDAFFRRWVLWSDGATLRAQAFVNGRPAGALRSAPHPTRRTLVPYARHAADDAVYAFLETPDRRLECVRVRDGALDVVFAYPLPPNTRRYALSADERAVHLALAEAGLADGGLAYERLSHDGRRLERREPFRTRHAPHALDVDAERAVVRAIFRDGPYGKHVQLVLVDLARATVAVQRLRLPVRGEVTELAFDRDPNGRFWLALATADGRLYVMDGPERAPLRLAREPARGPVREPFLPCVLAQRGVYVGCQREARGYRFLHLQRGRFQPHVLPYDALP